MPSAMKNTAAFWISPEGMILPVKTNHIGFVIEYPQLFDVSLDSIRQQYQRHHEPWGSEGKARHEIICALVKQGWIRIRRYRHAYSINIPVLDCHYKKSLTYFANIITEGGINDCYEVDIHMPCNISALQTEQQYNLTVAELRRLSESIQITRRYDVACTNQ